MPAPAAFRDGVRRRRRADVHLSFATKAFPCTAVLRVLAEEGIGADVASGGELADRAARRRRAGA